MNRRLFGHNLHNKYATVCKISQQGVYVVPSGECHCPVAGLNDNGQTTSIRKACESTLIAWKNSSISIYSLGEWSRDELPGP